MTNVEIKNLVMDCDELIEAALASLVYLESRSSSEEERMALGVLMREYRAFADIKNILVDAETGLFITGAALRTVTAAIKRAGTDIFGSHFPMLQYKAFDLFTRLNDAGQQAVLTGDTYTEETVH